MLHREPIEDAKTGVAFAAKRAEDAEQHGQRFANGAGLSIEQTPGKRAKVCAFLIGNGAQKLPDVGVIQAVFELRDDTLQGCQIVSARVGDRVALLSIAGLVVLVVPCEIHDGPFYGLRYLQL
ncbi:hypothetical protein GCM10011395_24650 [Sphingomonas psychrolutea]|uniref:Uncharacterized protein n=1 Tax=Sphingomonas psychrolutea TaxID=1259676 RepID=A0ABQ1H0V7_9SPHN|nr:hypothetical protein GCM10011395_24650 [Sphingomonas psychrolutea]